MHSLVPEQSLTLKIYTNTMPRENFRLRRQFVSPFFAGKSSLKRRALALGILFKSRRKKAGECVALFVRIPQPSVGNQLS